MLLAKLPDNSVLAVGLELALREWSVLEIFAAHTPAPASIRVIQVVTTDDRRVLARLVGGEVSDEAPVAEGGGIAVQ
jgi:hypothetical protein